MGQCFGDQEIICFADLQVTPEENQLFLTLEHFGFAENGDLILSHVKAPHRFSDNLAKSIARNGNGKTGSWFLFGQPVLQRFEFDLAEIALHLFDFETIGKTLFNFLFEHGEANDRRAEIVIVFARLIVIARAQAAEVDAEIELGIIDGVRLVPPSRCGRNKEQDAEFERWKAKALQS